MALPDVIFTAGAALWAPAFFSEVSKGLIYTRRSDTWETLATGLGMGIGLGMQDGFLNKTVAGWKWWKGNKPRRDRARKLIGGKSRAILAEMQARLRDAGQLRSPVPVPNA